MAITSYARLLLEHWGVVVDDIPTSEKEESDFLAAFGATKVLIEEKTKLDDAGHLAQRAQMLDTGEIHASSLPLVRDNRLSGIVSKAARQLQSSATHPHDFRLVWFTATGTQAEAKYHQFIATLYGTTKIFEMNQSFYRTCYFFRNSDFHRHATILDGAVAAYVSGTSITAKLCLNPLSPNYAVLKSSAVVSTFGSGIEDPVVRETDGESFILDADIDRNDESALLAYLQQKYSTAPLMKFDMGYLSAAIRVPDSEG
ncbi:hypothetical protein [Pseudomonas citronellolis]|uniref:hypothetical protein n=1 Tax=Pseudomonas citronellolis TaxID=53408 RepID=UPI003C2F5A14